MIRTEAATITDICYAQKIVAQSELAEIKTPETVTPIAIEHYSMEKVIQALKYLQLPSPSMKVLDYVDCLIATNHILQLLCSHAPSSVEWNQIHYETLLS